MDKRKETLLTAIRAFVRQRPGMDPRNYGNVSAYRSESRSITRDLHDAEKLLDYIAWHDSISADDILAATRSSFSGRLTITEDAGAFRLDYCAGQYFPTEYRRAVCAVCTSLLFDYYRGVHRITGAATYKAVRAAARRELGRSIAQRWFR